MEVFKEGTTKMRPLGWALKQHDWCPYKKSKLGHRYTNTEDRKKTAMYLRIKERGPQEKPNLLTP